LRPVFNFIGTARVNYGKSSTGSNRILKKNKKKLAARQKTLRRVAEFGFILTCGIDHQLSRPIHTAAA
jgi:hypothetical protein